MNMKSLTLAATTLLLVACASTAEQANETATRNLADVAVLNAAPCCVSPADIPYVDLRSGRTDKIPINQTTPVVAVGTGRSHAVGFRAPPRLAPTYLVIRTFSGGSAFAPGAANFVPSFLFFNDDGTSIETAIKWTIRSSRSDWIDGSHLEATIELPPSPTPTRVLVYTEPSAINKRSPIIVDAGAYLVPNGIYGAVRAIWP
jgi:hypothetical protein